MFNIRMGIKWEFPLNFRSIAVVIFKYENVKCSVAIAVRGDE